MENVLEEAVAPSSPADLCLYQGLLRDQQNNDGNSLSPKNMEGVYEEAGAHSSPAANSLHQGLLRDQENNNDRSSVLGNTNEGTVMRENGKHGVFEYGVEIIECQNEDETKAGSNMDKETIEISLGKLDDSKEKENGLGSEHDLEVEDNESIGDHSSTGDIDDNVGKSEDLDGKGNTVRVSVGENMDTCSEERRKILISEVGFVYSALTNEVDSKHEIQVDEGAVHEMEQEHNGNGCKTEQIGCNESEYSDDKSSYECYKLKGKDALASSNNDVVKESSRMRDSEDNSAVSKDTEKLTEDAEGSEGVICNNEVVVERSGTDDSEGVICHGDVIMEMSELGDSVDINAVSKDADKPTEDAEESEGVISNDELMMEGSGIGDSEDKSAVKKDTDKSTEDPEEIEENQNSGAMPVEDVREMGAEMTQEEKKNKTIVEVIEEEGDKMNLEMTEGKEEMDVEMREEKENEMDLEMSEGKEMGVEMAEEKEERDVEMTDREKEKGVAMTEENGMDLETSEGKEMGVEMAEEKEKERDVEMTDGEEKKGVAVTEGNEKSIKMTKVKERDVEMAEGKEFPNKRKEGKEKERDVEMAEGKEMSIKVSEEKEEEVGVERTEEKEKESDIEEKECGGTRGEGVQEETEESQEYKGESSTMEESQDKIFNEKEKSRGGKKKEFADKVYTSMEKEETQKAANGDVIEFTKGSMAEESQNQDDPEEGNVSKEINQDSAEESLTHRDEREACKEQNDGVNHLGQSYPLKESEKQTCELGLEQQQKEANTDITELTAAEKLQNKANEEQIAETNVDQSDVLNATEDSLRHIDRYQPEADEGVSKRAGESDIPNLDKASPNQTEQSEPEIQEVEKGDNGQSIEKRGTLNQQEVERSSSWQSIEERGTLNQQEVEKSSSRQSNEERETLNQQGEVQQDTRTCQVAKKSDNLLESGCISLEVGLQVVPHSLSGKEVTVEAGQCGEKNYSRETKHKGIDIVTPSYEKEQSSLNVGNVVCGTSEILTGKNSIAKKSASKMDCKAPKSSKDHSIHMKGEKGRQKQRRGERGEITPAGLHKHKSSPQQHHPAKEESNNNMEGQRNESAAVVPKIVHLGMPKSSAVYVYSGHPEGCLTPMPLSTVISQPRKQTEEVHDSDDSDIEIISENIVSSRSVSVPVKVAPMVCDVCQVIWNNDVLEAIFEGNKAVTVNSKITYGAILCFNRYAEARYWQNKEQTLRNVLERADLGKNIGNLKMVEVIKWLSRMMRDGSAKCCDVFDAVYSSMHASTILASFLNQEPKDAPELVPRQQNIQKPVEETPKRKIGNSSRVNSQGKASSGTTKPTTPQGASTEVSYINEIRKAVKSTHTEAEIKGSPVSSGDVLKEGEATLKKSNVHIPKTGLKNFSRGSDKNPLTQEEIILKECSVYLGKRVQIPQQRSRLQSISSSPATSKRVRSLEEVDKEVPCKKKAKVSGLPLSDKKSADTEGSNKSEDEKEEAEQTASRESTAVAYPPATPKRKQCHEKEVDKELPHEMNDRVFGLSLNAKESADTQGSFNLEDKDPDERTASKKSTAVVLKQSLDSVKSEGPAEESGMLELDTPEDENTNDVPFDRDTTSVPKQLGDEESTAEPEQKMDESDKNTTEKDTVTAQEDIKDKLMPHDHIDVKRLDKRSRKPSSRKETTKETSIMLVEDKTKRVKQDVSTNVLAGNSLPKQKKRPSMDPISQSPKKQKILMEAQNDSLDEDMPECLSKVDRRLSPTVCRKTRSTTKRLTSADSRDSESLSLSLENTSDSLSDEPPRSCESSGESDYKVSGKRLVSPIERRSEKTLKSPKALRTRSQRAAAVKKVASSSESSSDSCDQQMTHAGDLIPQSRRSMDCKLESSPDSTEESTNMLIQQLGLNVSGINLYCSVADTKIFTNGDMVSNSSERGKSIPALEAMLKERSNLDGVAGEAFDLLPFEPNNLSSTGNSGSRERYLTNQELLVLQNICVLNPENPDVDMFYQILMQILLSRKRVLLVPNSLSLLLVAEGIRREFNRAKRKGNYVLYLAQDWDANKIYTAEDFWLGNKRPPNVPTVSTVLSMFCLWKNLEKRVPISFPIALEELCRNLVLWDVDKIGTCVKLYSRYCTFLYEEKNASLAEFFLNQPFVGSQTELQKKNLLCRMAENSKQTSGKSSSRHSFNVTENDVQMLMKKCMEAEQAVLRSSSPRDEENFRKCVQALKYKIDAYKKEIHLIQKVTKETEKKKSQLLSKLSNPQFKDCTTELSKIVETLYRMLSKRTTKFEVIREIESMSVKETNRASRPPLVLKGADLGEDVSESMKELVYELLINEVKMEEVRPILCAIVQNLSDKSLSVVPTDSWIRNFARAAGLKVRTRSNFLHW